jgi:hypothetical protein
LLTTQRGFIRAIVPPSRGFFQISRVGKIFFIFIAEIGTAGHCYILTRTRTRYSDNSISVKRGEMKMFDNLKEKSEKKSDDRFRKNGMPVIIKIDKCSIFSDPKIAELMVEHR